MHRGWDTAQASRGISAIVAALSRSKHTTKQQEMLIELLA